MGLLRMAARTAVVAGTASATAGAVQHHQQQKYAAQEASAAPAAAPVAAAPAASTGDQLAEIEKLGDLKAKGLLTDEEFAAKKAQILGI